MLGISPFTVSSYLKQSNWVRKPTTKYSSKLKPQLPEMNDSNKTRRTFAVSNYEQRYEKFRKNCKIKVSITYILDMESADSCKHHLGVAQVHKRVMTAAQQESTHADVLPLHKHRVRYYSLLSTHVQHALC